MYIKKRKTIIHTVNVSKLLVRFIDHYIQSDATLVKSRSEVLCFGIMEMMQQKFKRIEDIPSKPAGYSKSVFDTCLRLVTFSCPVAIDKYITELEKTYSRSLIGRMAFEIGINKLVELANDPVLSHEFAEYSIFKQNVSEQRQAVLHEKYLRHKNNRMRAYSDQEGVITVKISPEMLAAIEKDKANYRFA